MKAGDYVIKVKGHHKGMTGIVLYFSKNHTFGYVIVYAEGLRRKWLYQYTAVINEAG